MDVALKVLATTQQIDRGEHAVGHLRGPARDARRQEEAIGKPGSVCVHEHARHLLGAQKRATHLAAAEGRAVATGQRAGVGLHNPHEPGRALTGVTYPGDAHGVSRAHQRALGAVAVSGLGENRYPGSEVHGDFNYT